MNPQDTIAQQNKMALRRAELKELKAISFEEMEAVFNKWMIIPDKGILKFIAAYYCAKRLPGKALWAIIIGPSGGGKTEFLNSLLMLEDVVPISTLTPNTFLSGMPGRNDASLLPQLNDKIGLFKDWTTMLSMQPDAKGEIMSQFREIYDGSMKKAFGNGKVVEWEGKVSILAASTQAVDLNQQQYTHLGERFLNYRIIMPDRKAVAMRALDNDENQDLMAKELQDAMYAFMKGVDFENLTKVIKVPTEELKNKIVALANFCTMARSGIIRDFGMKKEVVFVPSSEMPTRITSQLSKLLSGLVMINKGVLNEKDLEIIYKVALDSIPQTNKMVIAEMARGDNQTTSDIANALGYPTEPIRIYLENLSLLKVCKRIKDGSNSYKWKMEEEFVEIIRHYEHVAPLTKEELQARVDEELFDGTGNDDALLDSLGDEEPWYAK